MERDGLTLRYMIMRRIFLFFGAAWMVVRFSFLYFALSAELGEAGSSSMGLLLFSFGSLHAVMAAGYLMSGFFIHRYDSVIKLLAAGQVFAVCGDIAFLLSLLGGFGLFPVDYGALPVFPMELSPLAAGAGMLVADAVFLGGMLSRRIKPSGRDRLKEHEPDEGNVPDVHEVSLEEE